MSFNTQASSIPHLITHTFVDEDQYPWDASLISAHPSYPTAEADHRLVLLYLANDILQNGKRKGADMFTDLFRESLEQVVPLIW